MTDKQLNERIKMLAKNSRISYPENYNDFINKVLEELPEEPEESDRRCRRWRKSNGWRPVPALVVTVLIVVIAGASVGAGVRGYFKRMENMTGQEKEEYIEGIEEIQMNGDYYSREFTSREEKRGQALAISYEAGKRYPKKELPVVEKETNAMAHRLCFVKANSTFYLPEEELSDEELLEIIDFYYKRDYSMQTKRLEESKAKEEKLNKKGKLSKSELRTIAEKYIQKIYNTDVTKWSCQIEHYKTYEKKERYSLVSYENKASQQLFYVEIKERSKECTEMTMKCQEKTKGKSVKPVAQSEMQALQKDALDIVKKLESQLTIEMVQCQYMEIKAGIPVSGKIDFVCSQSDGQGYVLSYVSQAESFCSISYWEDINGYLREYKDRAKNKKCKIINQVLYESNVAEKEAD